MNTHLLQTKGKKLNIFGINIHLLFSCTSRQFCNKFIYSVLCKLASLDVVLYPPFTQVYAFLCAVATPWGGVSHTSCHSFSEKYSEIQGFNDNAFHLLPTQDTFYASLPTAKIMSLL